MQSNLSVKLQMSRRGVDGVLPLPTGLDLGVAGAGDCCTGTTGAVDWGDSAD